VAELLNHRLLERVRALLHQADLPKNLWAEVIKFAVWLKNRTSTKALGNVMPYERLYGQKPNLSGVPEWGQFVWVHNPTGSKLDTRATQARWVGYDAESTHAHRIYWPDTKHISIECNIKFVPPAVAMHSPPPSYKLAIAPAPQCTAAPQHPALPRPPPPAQPEPPPQQLQAPPPHRAVAQPAPGPSTLTLPPADVPSPASSLTSPPSTPTQRERDFQVPGAPKKPTLGEQLSKLHITPRRTLRQPQPSAQIRRLQAGEGTTGKELDYVFSAGFDDIIAAAIQDMDADPKTLAQAQSRSDWLHWKEAMDRELATLKKVGTWITVPRPTDKNIVSSKWVFRVKHKADSTIDKYKARLAARGFTQVYGVDYFVTFSPVAKLSSFRLILAIAVHYNWDAESFNFNGAYLNRELDDNACIHPPVTTAMRAL
jgi:hypothetical protein